jgi:hypothetical protein
LRVRRIAADVRDDLRVSPATARRGTWFRGDLKDLAERGGAEVGRGEGKALDAFGVGEGRGDESGFVVGEGSAVDDGVGDCMRPWRLSAGPSA